MVKNQLYFARVVMRIPKDKPRKSKYAIFEVAYWINDNIHPYWASGNHLRYKTIEGEYRVYNPNRLQFDLMELIARIKWVHAHTMYQDAASFVLVTYNKDTYSIQERFICQ